MRKDIEKRLEELQREFAFGQQQHAQIEQTLVRISGAIQVLEELLGERPPTENGSTPVAAPVAT